MTKQSKKINLCSFIIIIFLFYTYKRVEIEAISKVTVVHFCCPSEVLQCMTQPSVFGKRFHSAC